MRRYRLIIYKAIIKIVYFKCAVDVYKILIILSRYTGTGPVMDTFALRDYNKLVFLYIFQRKCISFNPNKYTAV